MGVDKDRERPPTWAARGHLQVSPSVPEAAILSTAQVGDPGGRTSDHPPRGRATETGAAEDYGPGAEAEAGAEADWEHMLV